MVPTTLVPLSSFAWGRKQVQLKKFCVLLEYWVMGEVHNSIITSVLRHPSSEQFRTDLQIKY
jgi:hypothetical protein